MKETKRIRAWNIRINDELLWFDSNAGKEVTMIVTGFDLSFPGVQQLFLRKKCVRKTALPYRWNMGLNKLVRVRRESEK